MSVRSEAITVSGVRLVLHRTGDGPPVLWLHGTDGLAEWPQIIDRLAATHEVIAPDLPGFGESEAPGWIDDVSDLAYLHLDLIAKLGLGQLPIVGHSLGGWVALEMAVRCTRRLARLVLIAPAGIHVKGVRKADIFMIDPAEQAHLAYADQGFAAAAAQRAELAMNQDMAIANRVASARYGWNPRFHNPRLGRWLHRVDVPTLIIWGGEDRVFDPAHAPAMKQLIPGAQLAVIAGAGHLPHIERPDQTFAAMTAFGLG